MVSQGSRPDDHCASFYPPSTVAGQNTDGTSSSTGCAPPKVPWLTHSPSVPHSPLSWLLSRWSSCRDVNPHRVGGIEPTDKGAPTAGTQSRVDLCYEVLPTTHPRQTVNPCIVCTNRRRKNGMHGQMLDHTRESSYLPPRECKPNIRCETLV